MQLSWAGCNKRAWFTEELASLHKRRTRLWVRFHPWSVQQYRCGIYPDDWAESCVVDDFLLFQRLKLFRFCFLSSESLRFRVCCHDISPQIAAKCFFFRESVGLTTRICLNTSGMRPFPSSCTPSFFISITSMIVICSSVVQRARRLYFNTFLMMLRKQSKTWARLESKKMRVEVSIFRTEKARWLIDARIRPENFGQHWKFRSFSLAKWLTDAEGWTYVLELGKNLSSTCNPCSHLTTTQWTFSNTRASLFILFSGKLFLFLSRARFFWHCFAKSKLNSTPSSRLQQSDILCVQLVYHRSLLFA